ncbi:sigma-54 interaction domain-containing protein [Salinisphaera hydrothermalis]|uniref:HTH-type transcriptional regulatory protein TyrR n=1 Tax=Salinisphaera hydrothermalis (strain C41B8) TaxID=1304275 RepID=A0A084II17_SALHC|nr:sigma 54-interacting transcriptional regulator [Salinisphaera hydrothermalis]KEZ76351.1 putative PAS/PAC sensor protein [Salinisphaera hydrothermalis C41B8]
MPSPDNLQALELDAVLAHSHDHVVIADQHGRILKASESCAGVYGLPLQEFIGASTYDLEHNGVLSPSITVRVLEQRRACHVMQATLTGRSVMASAYPVWDGDRLVRVVSLSKDMTDIRSLQREYELLHRQLIAREAAPATALDPDADIPTCNPRMREIVSLLERVAPTDASVVLLGETGVGKTRIAGLLHRLSQRSNGPFVEANCGAIPDTLFESEMFGYVAGAFSGAARNGKPGLAERAHGGTLFLDEIAELSAQAQTKLLRVLQDRRVTRLGSTDVRTADFRLIAATNRDLEAQVAEGRFRLDLYHRINVVPVTIPALAERAEDIPLFIQRMLHQLNTRYGQDKTLAPETWSYLLGRSWPGNLRELENYLERLYVLAAGPTISPGPTTGAALDAEAGQKTDREAAPRPLHTLREAVETAERECLQAALSRCRSTYEMAHMLGSSQPTVFRKLRKYGLAIDTDPAA